MGTAKECICGTVGKCVDSRNSGKARRRNYQCPVCGEKWTTIEHRVEKLRNGSRVEAFYDMELHERAKLRESLRPHLEAMLEMLAPVN